ncbi:hypothetical protein [Lactobacillus gasseri]|uniref:hypothetical protein n=1 Tax=Lactobacillus gasseri TaxID=1596 RepID=UPI001F2277BF|nr:hypothetical protein [Lactobacillus gasseri]MCZ3541806.1 hypothetical protein [Lactobacillus gasseri]MCZ3589431.1 hypothetical protein [Lactobacillus gasseri]UJD19650.1 hypothetical protein M497_03615 [Lactobacillus gasseri 2016]
MIKVMLILWYLLVGIIWLLSLKLCFSDEFNYASTGSLKHNKLGDVLVAVLFTIIFLIIALIPNFIGAVIQWIVSLFH